MNPNNFHNYETLGLPMLITFLDYKTKKKSMKRKNRKMRKILRKVAKLYENEIKVATVDITKYGNKMESMGLFGGKSAVPASAINVEGGGIFPLDQIDRGNSISQAYISKYVNEFLAGRIEPLTEAELGRRAQIMNKRLFGTKSSSKNRRPKYKKGVREKFDSNDDIVQLSRLDGKDGGLDSYRKYALDETKDVLILLHDSRPGHCDRCEYLAPYYKRVASRFKDLKVTSVIISRFDVGAEAAPQSIQRHIKDLPTILLLKAFSKNPPFPIYSGSGKVRPIMDWVKQNAAVKFQLPELPEFDATQREMFKEQVEELYGGSHEEEL